MYCLPDRVESTPRPKRMPLPKILREPRWIGLSAVQVVSNSCKSACNDARSSVQKLPGNAKTRHGSRRTMQVPTAFLTMTSEWTERGHANRESCSAPVIVCRRRPTLFPLTITAMADTKVIHQARFVPGWSSGEGLVHLPALDVAPAAKTTRWDAEGHRPKRDCRAAEVPRNPHDCGQVQQKLPARVFEDEPSDCRDNVAAARAMWPERRELWALREL